MSTTSSEKRIFNSIWDFRNANTKIYTHCYHNYPAMMIPQIANQLIHDYGKKATKLFDPYCGTGTSLVEANIKGIDAYGTDLNPLARLIAKTKTSRIKLQIVDKYLQLFQQFLSLSENAIPMVVIPNFKNINFWFTEETKIKLATIKYFIDTIENEKVKDFFLLAFSETVRESSLTRNNEFKLYRMSEQQRNAFNPDVYKIIHAKLVRNRKGLQEYLEKMKSVHSQTIVYDFNSSENIEPIQEQSIDIIVTSPPYGDSKTTVAYGQFSRLTHQWLGIENAHTIDTQLMGGRIQTIHKTGLDIIDTVITRIAEIDEKRAKEVYSFYADYHKSIARVAKTIKIHGYACYVVGNRKVKNTVLPTNEITKSLFQEYGFEHTRTFIRNIPNKRMPYKNSPTNQKGKTSSTMNSEYIVIMKKRSAAFIA